MGRRNSESPRTPLAPNRAAERAQSANAAASTRVWVDAHVHIHPCYRLGPFLDGAAANFARAAAEIAAASGTNAAGDEGPIGCLLLAESAGDAFYRALDASAREGGEFGAPAEPGAARWRLRTTGEEISLRAERSDGALLYLIAGRQVAAREGLEVLALGTLREFPDRRALRDSIDDVRASGALAVLPWGFGKWWLRRRALIEEILDSVPPGSLFLGDNSGRPGFAGRPSLFRQAERRGFRVLPGTDPLPFPHEEGRAGTLGAALRVSAFNPERPAASILGALRTSATELVPFGRLEQPLRFVRHQIGMQLYKRRRRS